jgi:DNA-binding XRE family transcriptional regulator
MAGQIGVPTVEITRAEARPQDKVRPALQVAVRDAMDEAKKAWERVTSGRKGVDAGGASATRREASVGAPATNAVEAAPTGADLARWRAGARLTQQRAADILGVRQGTASKAERRSTTQLRTPLCNALCGAIATP